MKKLQKGLDMDLMRSRILRSILKTKPNEGRRFGILKLIPQKTLIIVLGFIGTVFFLMPLGQSLYATVIEIPTYDESGSANGTEMFDHPPPSDEGLIEVPYHNEFSTNMSETEIIKLDPNSPIYVGCLNETGTVRNETIENMKRDDPKITPEELKVMEQNIKGQDVSFCLGQYNYLTYGKR